MTPPAKAPINLLQGTFPSGPCCCVTGAALVCSEPSCQPPYVLFKHSLFDEWPLGQA